MIDLDALRALCKSDVRSQRAILANHKELSFRTKRRRSCVIVLTVIPLVCSCRKANAPAAFDGEVPGLAESTGCKMISHTPFTDRRAPTCLRIGLLAGDGRTGGGSMCVAF